ncbi:MAG: DUF4870 domain-containing protein [Planctomycetota bacterium]
MSDTPEPSEGQAPETPTPPPAEPTPPTEEATAPADLTDDDKNMAMLAHLLGIILSVIGPLIIWLIKKDDSKFVDQEGKEALNFQLTVFLVYIVLVPVTVITCGFGVFLYLPVWVGALVLAIVAALKAKDGIAYRYPLTLRLVK